MVELIYPPETAPVVPPPSVDNMSGYPQGTEWFPVVEPTGIVTGRASRAYCHSGAKVLHPVVHLHLIDRFGRLYLQKRSMRKDIQPGRWDTAVGGHLDYGESITEALYREAGNDLLDYSVGRIILKKVTHTAEITSIRAKVRIHEIYLPMGKKPYTKKRKRTLTLQRARYPEKRKADGSFLTERECPSCGANFVPDEHHCCSFCGYGLQTANARWIVQKGRK